MQDAPRSAPKPPGRNLWADGSPESPRGWIPNGPCAPGHFWRDRSWLLFPGSIPQLGNHGSECRLSLLFRVG